MSSTGQPFLFGAWRRGSASALGAESRWFKSSRPDHVRRVMIFHGSFFYLIVPFKERRKREKAESLLNREMRGQSDLDSLKKFFEEEKAVRPRLTILPKENFG